MKLFNKKSSETQQEISIDKKTEGVNNKIERPRICCININNSIIKQLKEL